MREVDIVVQPCGCISLPDEVVAQLGAHPGAVLRLSFDTDRASAALERLSSPEQGVALTSRVACPIDPAKV